MNNYFAILEGENESLDRKTLYITERNKLSALLALKQQYSNYIVTFITEV